MENHLINLELKLKEKKQENNLLDYKLREMARINDSENKFIRPNGGLHNGLLSPVLKQHLGDALIPVSRGRRRHMVSQSYDVTGVPSRASNRTFKSRLTHHTRNDHLDQEVERVNELNEGSERSIDTATIMIPSSMKQKITTTASQLPSHQRGTEFYMR